MSSCDEIINWIVSTYSPHNFFGSWGLILLLCVLLHIGERVLPAERNQSYWSMATNGRITFVYAILTPIAQVGANYLAGYLITMMANRLPRPWLVLDFNNFANGQSEIARIVLLILFTFTPLFVYDFFYYWFHRLQHANSWLWEQHKLHHSDQALNVTTSYRLNWLEEFFKILLVYTPIALVVGLQPDQGGLVTSLAVAITKLQGQFLHSNMRLSFGFLSAVVAGPQFHRIHHSIEMHHQNKNFTTFFPIFDLLFGTYYRPSREEYPKTGVIGEPSNPNTYEILIGPLLRWGHRLRVWKSDC
jgi:sterol desaturase/sphingolipid hydroxylase (fatty acid hydroxylase superfamily)